MRLSSALTRHLSQVSRSVIRPHPGLKHTRASLRGWRFLFILVLFGESYGPTVSVEAARRMARSGQVVERMMHILRVVVKCKSYSTSPALPILTRFTTMALHVRIHAGHDSYRRRCILHTVSGVIRYT